MIRLQKALADRGVASRRAAEALIAGGRVRVDGSGSLTLGAGVVIKANRNGTVAMTSGGQLFSQGTSSNPVVMTSLQDDTVGGDTNNDGNFNDGTKGQASRLRVRNAKEVKIVGSCGSRLRIALSTVSPPTPESKMPIGLGSPIAIHHVTNQTDLTDRR